MSTDTIAHLKVTLDDVEPTVMRRLEVPLNLRLDRLHLVLQVAIGWTDTHLWEIRARDVGWVRRRTGGASATALSRHRRQGYSIWSTTPAPRRSSISTTSAMAGSIRSRSSGSAILHPKAPTHAWPRPWAVVRPKMSAGLGAMPNSSRRSAIQHTSDTPSSPNGAAPPSIPMRSSAMRLTVSSPSSLDAGHASQLPEAAEAILSWPSTPTGSTKPSWRSST